MAWRAAVAASGRLWGDVPVCVGQKDRCHSFFLFCKGCVIHHGLFIGGLLGIARVSSIQSIAEGFGGRSANKIMGRDSKARFTSIATT